MARVGVVCEGSHDFIFIKPLADQVLLFCGQANNTFKALQPKIDATSRQTDGGGFQAVLEWLKRESGLGIRKYFDGPLFASSDELDLIVVHLDGDVGDLSSDMAAAGFGPPFPTVADRVYSVRSFAKALAKAEPALADKIVIGVPVLQMESWVLSVLKPSSKSCELKGRKGLVKSLLKKRFGGKAAFQVDEAGKIARNGLVTLSSNCVSFQMFENDLKAVF